MFETRRHSIKHKTTIRAGLAVVGMSLLAAGARAEDWQPRWSEESLSVARYYLAGAAAGTKVVFAGGVTNGSYNTIAAVDIYDTVNQAWSTTNLSQARYLIATATVGTKVLFAGGAPSSAQARSAVVDIYDTANNTWSKTNLSLARSDIAAATVGTKVLFAGGKTNGNTYAPANVVDIYDAANNTWSTAHLSSSRQELAVAVVGTKVLFAGGKSTLPDTNVVDVYDAASNSWSTAHLSNARCYLSSTVAGTKVMFAGGFSGSTFYSVVDIYNSSNNTWSTTNLSLARYFMGAAAVGTKALFAGGGVGNNTTYSLVDIYDTANNTRSTANLSQARSGIKAETLGTMAIFFGGGNSSGDSDAVDIYDTANNTWRVESCSQARSGFGSAAVGEHALFAGGLSGSPKANVDIYRRQNYVTVTSTNSFTLCDTTAVAGRLLQNGGALILGSYDLAVGSMGGTAPITLGAQTMTVGSDNTSADYAGQVSVNSGLLVKTGTGTQTFSNVGNTLGPVNVNQGVLALTSGLYSGGGTVGIAGGAGLIYSDTLNRSVTNNGTLTGPSGASWLTLGGAVAGTGSYIGNVKFAQRFSPGNNGPSHVDLANVIFDSANTLELDVNGATAGSQYDQLHVSGAATLGGTLRLNLGGFMPGAGQTFVLLTGPMSGRFETLVGVPAGWGAEYASGSVTLKQLPTVSSVAVTPAAVSVPVSGTQAFTALALDAAGNLLSVQPSFAWAVTGGGTIDSAGVFTAGGTVGGPHAVTAAAGGVIVTGTVWVTAAGSQAPTVATVPGANPNPLTAKTTSLTVFGADDGGEAALTYTWATAGTPPAAVAFSANGSNGAKNTTATFTKAGVYSLQVRIQDAGGALALASLTVTVSQTPNGLAVLPPNPSVNPSATRQFTASLVDQFGEPIASPMTFAWSVSGGGTIDQSGLFTAAGAEGGPYTVTAGLSANTGVTIANGMLPQSIAGFQVQPGGSGFVLSWASDTGETYRIETNTNLVSGVWAPGTSVYVATPPMNVGTVTVDQAPQKFYRVSVE